jgi:hypothetical protein
MIECKRRARGMNSILGGRLKDYLLLGYRRSRVYKCIMRQRLAQLVEFCRGKFYFETDSDDCPLSDLGRQV